MIYSIANISWADLVLIVTASAFVGELCWLTYCRTAHPLAKVPGPFLASFSRLWLWHTVRQGQLHLVELSLHQKYGKLVRIAPNEVSCSDPAAIKELYRNQNPLEKSDFYTTWDTSAFGKHKDNFSVTNEKDHSERRRIVNHVYSLSNVLKSEKYIDECSRLFMRKLGEHADAGRPIDLGQWLQMYAFDVVGELYFGRMFGFMEQEIDYQNLIQSLDVLNPVLASVAVSATYARPFILLSAVAFGSVRRGLKGIEHVIQAAKDTVSARQARLANVMDDTEAPREDLLQQLFGIMQEKGEKVDFGIPDIQCEAYVAIFAGSDTTAIAMRSVLYHLSRSPTVMQQLVREIDDAFSTTQAPDQPVRYADAIQLSLLCATIKEAMRLHPSVGFTMPRVSPRPTGLQINGIQIPPGYRVGMNAIVIQRDQTIYGADADEFNPQRWLPENTSVDRLREMERCMLNFGAGTRTCIGKNISLSEIHKLIPQVLRNFQLERLDAPKPWTTHNYWFNKQTGLEFLLKRRTM